MRKPQKTRHESDRGYVISTLDRNPGDAAGGIRKNRLFVVGMEFEPFVQSGIFEQIRRRLDPRAVTPSFMI